MRASIRHVVSLWQYASTPKIGDARLRRGYNGLIFRAVRDSRVIPSFKHVRDTPGIGSTDRIVSHIAEAGRMPELPTLADQSSRRMPMNSASESRTPLLSVVIPCYNEEEVIGET